MDHYRAIRELRRHFLWRGVWIHLRHEGLRFFLLHPREVYLDAESMSDGDEHDVSGSGGGSRGE